MCEGPTPTALLFEIYKTSLLVFLEIYLNSTCLLYMDSTVILGSQYMYVIQLVPFIHSFTFNLSLWHIMFAFIEDTKFPCMTCLYSTHFPSPSHKPCPSSLLPFHIPFSVSFHLSLFPFFALCLTRMRDNIQYLNLCAWFISILYYPDAFIVLQISQMCPS